MASLSNSFSRAAFGHFYPQGANCSAGQFRPFQRDLPLGSAREASPNRDFRLLLLGPPLWLITFHLPREAVLILQIENVPTRRAVESGATMTIWFAGVNWIRAEIGRFSVAAHGVCDDQWGEEGTN
ncbi:MAG: hypothetical protein CML99_06875 [Rhodobiaceae bacterium]|nr:hypothetical protein [Rhodobiaceae bacterium]